jgi:hypothetical protein
LGQWLGPAIDLGPAMTAKILKANGQVEYNSTDHSLTDAELDDPIQIAAHDAFMTQLNAVIGPPVEQEELALIHAHLNMNYMKTTMKVLLVQCQTLMLSCLKCRMDILVWR